MISKTFVNLNGSANPFFDGLQGDLGTRVEQGGPLLDRQIPGIARLLGSGWARRRR
nr:hypothetical protein [Dietzia maris]